MKAKKRNRKRKFVPPPKRGGTKSKPSMAKKAITVTLIVIVALCIIGLLSYLSNFYVTNIHNHKH